MAKLTVRRLAAELGIGTTTLYHHVRNKEELLLLLLDESAGQIVQPELPDDPHDRIVVAATALHETLAAWPWAAEVLTTDGFVGLLGEPALWTVETIVAGGRGRRLQPGRGRHGLPEPLVLHGRRDPRAGTLRPLAFRVRLSADRWLLRPDRPSPTAEPVDR